MKTQLRLCLIAGLAFISLNCGGIGAAPDASVGDTPSKGPVGKTMRTNSEKFIACARDSVTVQTESTQTLELQFTIDARGNVLKAKIDDITTPDPDLSTCVLRVLKNLKFPPPKDGKPKSIHYPLVLKPE